MAARRRGKYAVIGLGTFGEAVALELERLGNEVLGVDDDEERVEAMKDRVSHAVIADVRDERNIEALGLADYDAAVVAIGEDLEANVLCTLALKQIGVSRVWVKALTPGHHRVLEKVGADRIIHPEHEIGRHVAQALNYPYVVDYIALGSDYFVVELEVTDTVAGDRVSELGLEEDFGVRFVALKQGREPTYDPDTRLETGQRLVLIGPLDGLERFGGTL